MIHNQIELNNPNGILKIFNGFWDTGFLLKILVLSRI